MGWYGSAGCDVYLPVGHSPDIDFIADDGERLIKVQVKTCGYVEKGRWAVSICTRGGNRSWTGVTKYFCATRCDELFVVTVDGRRWRIPAEAVQAATAVRLGGPKYSEFEVDAGPPLSDSLEPRSLSCRAPGGLAKRSNAADCKSALSEFPGSNHGPAITA
jgi:hypothetical protein